MSIDYAALTQAAVAGFPDVRCCAMVSRDGLVLGCSPAADEERAMVAWRRLPMLGEVDRGFLALRDELWVVCRRGPYGAVAVAAPSARPGLILDQLEQALLAAEEARTRREGVKPSGDRDSVEGSRGPRSNLHREARATGERDDPPGESLEPTSAWARLLQRPATPFAEETNVPLGTAGVAGPTAASEPVADLVVHLPDTAREPEDLPAEAGAADTDPDDAAYGAPAAPEGSAGPAPASPTREEDVDRVELSREFAGLLFEVPPEEQPE